MDWQFDSLRTGHIEVLFRVACKSLTRLWGLEFPTCEQQDTSIWGIGANWEHMCFASMSKQFESAILHQLGALANVVIAAVWRTDEPSSILGGRTRIYALIHQLVEWTVLEAAKCQFESD